MVARGLCNACYQHEGRKPASCHPDRPAIARDLCRACYQREKRKDPEVRERWNKYRTENTKRATCHPDRPHYGRGLCAACCQKEWLKNNRLRVVARQYGMTDKDIAAMLERQDNACAVCRKAAPLMVDHCHATGRVRGLLCRRCNSALGWVNDDPEILRGLIAYLQVVESPST